MISSFFSKTKPINYLLLFVVFLFFYVIHFVTTVSAGLYFENLLPSFISLAGLALQVGLLAQMITKSRITQQTTFAIMVFTVLLIGFLDVIIDESVILSNFFMIWAVYELLLIEPSKKTSLEIYNATLWICVSSLFVPIAILFLTIIPVGIYMFSSNKLKNWLMPVMAIVTFFLITLAIALVLGVEAQWLNSYKISFKTDFLNTIDFASYTRLIVFVFTIVVLSALILLRSSISGGFRSIKLRFLLIVYIFAIMIALFSFGNDQGLEMILFSFCPAVLLTTNYFELFDLKRFKEPILAIGILIPLTFALYRMFSQ